MNVEWVETIDGGPGYKIKKLRYEAIPGLWIPALLYVPDNLEAKGKAKVAAARGEWYARAAALASAAPTWRGLLPARKLLKGRFDSETGRLVFPPTITRRERRRAKLAAAAEVHAALEAAEAKSRANNAKGKSICCRCCCC